MSEDYGPVDEAVKQWLLGAGTRVAAVTGNVYLAMPRSNPRPALLVRLVGGGPSRRRDLPLSRYRMQFDCIDASRGAASALMRALLADLDGLGETDPGVVVAGMYLGGAEVLSVRWQPDPDSDTPRYIVDALITTVQ